MPLMVIAARASRRSFPGRVLVLVAERPRHAYYELGRRQKSPVSPSRCRIAWFWSRVCGRQSADKRSPHQACASSLSFPTAMVAPGPRLASQRLMCSSDRKRFIVLQVNTMSSHHRAAGTRQWNSRPWSSGR